MLLFVMIMEGTMEYEPIWDAMYHLRIDKATFERIQSYSADLFRLSESLQTWGASKYSKTLRFVNLESLEIVHEYWRRYSSVDNLASSSVDNYNNAIKKIYNRYHKDIDPTDTTSACSKQFWNTGTLSSSAALPNPLFAYSDASSRFAVHQDSNPLVGFHLTTSVAKLAPESPFYQPRSLGCSDLESAISSAKLQFEAWCDAFRRLIKKDNPRLLVIRFFVGDAISFCLGLRALCDPSFVANCYSRPGVARDLRLDNDSRDRIPTQFDIIDAGHLVDRIGLLNLLPNVTGLLRNSCSVLYTSTREADMPAESNLLEKMLCADVGIMCMLLGVVPAAYLTGNTSHAYHAYHDSHPYTGISLNNRIMWVMTKAGDHKLEFGRVSPTCDVASLAKFLFGLYNNMFSFESNKSRQLTGSHAYTRHTFAALLRYFKRRVFIDWAECIQNLLGLLIADHEQNQTSNLREVMGEIFVQFALSDVYLGGVETTNVVAKRPVAPIGVLRKRNPPDPCAVAIIVPRERLQRIYDKLRADASNTPIAFQLYLRKEKCGEKDCTCTEENCRVSCVQAVFGKLVPSANGNWGRIEEDRSKWEGTSDLIVCGYFPTLIMRSWGEKGQLKCGVALTRTSETINLFEAEFGAGLSVWNTCFKHADSMHFFDRLPGLQQNHLKEASFLTSNRVAQATDSFVVDFPKLDFEKRSFTTRVKVIGPALDRFEKKDNISINQLSPCTLTITFGRFQVQGNYIFPVDGANSRLRVSRNNAWIEIIASFVHPTQRGYFTSTPFPIVLSSWGPIYNTFRSSVNFGHLPKLDRRLANSDASKTGNETASVPTHLNSMFIDNETSLPDANIPKSQIKIHIHSLLFPSPEPTVLKLRSQNSGQIDIVFFVVGLFLNPNSRSVVGEGYMMPMTAGTSINLPHAELKASAEEMMWWRSVLPGMVEQVRMWKHGPNCEYLFRGIPCAAAVPICSCGQGQVTTAFMDNKEWRKYAPRVTPVAITPIFPVPWLQSTRRTSIAQAMDRVDIKEETCKVCGKVGARKKCGKCLAVVYCSRECQIKDWREHKTSCGSANMV